MKLKGDLLFSQGDVLFRVYDNSEEGFTDYEFNISDLAIEIDDQFVTIREKKDGTKIIDYTDEVLGYK